MKIDTATFTSAATSLFAEREPALLEEIAQVKSAAEQEADRMTRKELAAALVKARTASSDEIRASTPKAELVKMYAEHAARCSEAAQYLRRLETAAEADRTVIEELNAFMDDVEELDALIAEIAAEHTGRNRVVGLRNALAKEPCAEYLEWWAVQILGAVSNGKDLREALGKHVPTMLATATGFIDDVATNGFGGTRTRNDAFAKAQAARHVLHAIVRIYQWDPSMKIGLGLLV